MKIFIIIILMIQYRNINILWKANSLNIVLDLFSWIGNFYREQKIKHYKSSFLRFILSFNSTYKCLISLL